MKKILALVMLLAAVTLPAAARSRVTTNVSELPATAQTTLSKYFGKSKVNHIKIDKKTFGGTEYDVILSNGTEIEFDANGNWKEIDCGANKLPDGLLLKSVADYVKQNYKNNNVVSVSVDRNKYEVELSGGAELEFDRAGNFRRVDY